MTVERSKCVQFEVIDEQGDPAAIVRPERQEIFAKREPVAGLLVKHVEGVGSVEIQHHGCQLSDGSVAPTDVIRVRIADFGQELTIIRRNILGKPAASAGS